MDRTRMSRALYLSVQRMLAAGAISKGAAASAIASTAEGYSFPTNLDRDRVSAGWRRETAI
ncbi:hypothetical protein [Mesorhizobium waimense]|uniref:hypothetical protein n=1 Tax=Mesorhizobium waimense TaxID=1300307 RepID=UPI0011C45B27|nr:hypothetical protein [Mesorhizobium waimense]